MTEVEIEYCVPCGMLDRAQALQHALLSEYGERLDSVTLVTGDSGVFEVRAAGDTVFDKDEDAFDEAAIVDSVGNYV